VVRAHDTGNILAFTLDATNAVALARQSRAHPVDAVIRACVLTATSGRRSAPKRAPTTSDLDQKMWTSRAPCAPSLRGWRGIRAAMWSRSRVHQHPAAELITHFGRVAGGEAARRRPAQHPNNVLKSPLTWSTEGLINEYAIPAGGQRRAAARGAPSEGLEEIEIDGTLYEAFNTSGGLGSLAETHGATSTMNYKTMRYPGHCSRCACS